MSYTEYDEFAPSIDFEESQNEAAASEQIEADQAGQASELPF